MKNFHAKLVINAENKHTAFVAFEALKPDNEVTPLDLTIVNRRSANQLIFEVSSSKIERILPTLDEILTCYNVIIESLRSIK